ncbi:MAG: AAA family ATPase [Clostridiales bacterium]|nr:AAA family ATPase [Clostridiales bacterium]
MWNGEIKVITGIRRCGKSVLLFDLFYNYLRSTARLKMKLFGLN